MADKSSNALSMLALGLAASGGGGTTNYNQLENKPQINSVELTGNKTLEDLGVQAELTAGEGIDITNNVISTEIVIPDIPDNVNTYVLKSIAGVLIWVAESVNPQGEWDGRGGFELTGNSYVDDNNRLHVED